MPDFPWGQVTPDHQGAMQQGPCGGQGREACSSSPQEESAHLLQKTSRERPDSSGAAGPGTRPAGRGGQAETERGSGLTLLGGPEHQEQGSGAALLTEVHSAEAKEIRSGVVGALGAEASSSPS